MRRAAAAVLALLLGAALLAGCGGDSSASADGRLRVVATTNWVADTARQIGGERVDVHALMGAGVDPHLYRAKASDVDALRDAEVVLWNGLDLEAKMEEAFATVGETKPVVAVAEAIPEDELIRVAANEFDPHVWMDPARWAHAARAIAAAYEEADPDGAAHYRQQLERFLDKLERLDADIRGELEAVPERARVLVTSHDAFGYFADAFDFEVVAIQGLSTEAEATTADIERVAGVIAERELRTVFIESSVPRQTIEAVLAAAAERGQRAEIGGELYSDNAGDAGTEGGTYEGALMHNARLIAEGLR